MRNDDAKARVERPWKPFEKNKELIDYRCTNCGNPKMIILRKEEMDHDSYDSAVNVYICIIYDLKCPICGHETTHNDLGG